MNEWPEVFAAGGIDFEVIPGAEVNSRSSGGYDAGPYSIGVHHDANPVPTSIDGERARARHHAFGVNISPIGAASLGPSGRWYLTAYGATNTQGKGGPLTTTRGVIPRDRGNLLVLSVEAMNNGQGAPWPGVQLDSYAAGCAVLEEWLGLDSAERWEDLVAHFEWTNPGKPIGTGGFRKIDPAGPPTITQGGYGVPDAAYPNMWAMDLFRADVAARRHTPPPEPEPEPEPLPPPEGPMLEYIAIPADTSNNDPWLYVLGSTAGYLTSHAHNELIGRGVEVVTVEMGQYALLKQSAGL